MKITTILMAMLLSFAIAPQSFAEGDQHQGADAHGSHAAKDGKPVTLTGDLIGLTCFIKHGSKGPSHKSCAKECAEKGLPIGLLVDGQIYQISGDGHKSLVEAYKPLLKFMESRVMVKGDVFEKDGMKILVIEKIKNG